jgi:hypothetical protein
LNAEIRIASKRKKESPDARKLSLRWRKGDRKT